MSESELRAQVHFQGTADCEEFTSNPFAKSGRVVRKCTSCGEDIASHRGEVVSADEVRKLLESVQSVPSEVLPGLLLGGFASAVNIKLLQEKQVKLVLNTAGELLLKQFPKLQNAVRLYGGHGIECLSLDWVDSEEQVLDVEEVQRVVTTVHSYLQRGEGVLVHCAQGRSRSSTVVIAYLMWQNHLLAERQDGEDLYDVALRVVEAARSMAQPNPSFERQLREEWTPRCLRL